MAMLNSLKLTQAKKPAQIPPVQVRRNKLAKRLHEQIELARAEQAGTIYSPKRYKSVKDDEGNRRTIEIAKRIKPWWFQSESGKVCVSIKYGSWTIELAKGKPSVEVASAEDLVKALTAIKTAVEAGELDAQIETASGALRAGFKR